MRPIANITKSEISKCYQIKYKNWALEGSPFSSQLFLDCRIRIKPSADDTAESHGRSSPSWLCQAGAASSPMSSEALPASLLHTCQGPSGGCIPDPLPLSPYTHPPPLLGVGGTALACSSVVLLGMVCPRAADLLPPSPCPCPRPHAGEVLQQRAPKPLSHGPPLGPPAFPLQGAVDQEHLPRPLLTVPKSWMGAQEVKGGLQRPGRRMSGHLLEVPTASGWSRAGPRLFPLAPGAEPWLPCTAPQYRIQSPEVQGPPSCPSRTCRQPR